MKLKVIMLDVDLYGNIWDWLALYSQQSVVEWNDIEWFVSIRQDRPIFFQHKTRT